MEREITHRCGHAQRHHLPGYWTCDQDRAAARLARRRCTACTERTRRAEAAALPPLTGTPRQVAWAEAIRRKQLAALTGEAPNAVDRALDQADARWWIDHRLDTPAQIAARVAG